MRIRQTIALSLCLLLFAGTLQGCNLLRTPYEREKIQEAGGSLKKASKGDEASTDAGGGGGGGGGGSDSEGGQGKQKKQPEEKKPDKSKAETYKQKEEREKGTGLLYTVPKALEDTTPHLRYSKQLSSETAKVEGVEGATVLIDEKHNAYVAVFSDGQPGSQAKSQRQTNKKLNLKAEGDVPPETQQKVAAKLRKADPLIGAVNITNDQSHVQTMQRYAREFANGGTNLNSQALAEHIEDIFK